MDDALTTAEAARLLGVKPNTVQHYIMKGVIPKEKATKRGRDYFISRCEIERLRLNPPKTGRPRRERST